jgi:2,3-bisphosphoglycerate-dependent phosphoglycerate mutase
VGSLDVVSDVHCPARILVTRHGETEYEAEEMGISGGSLTTLGRAQAHELGERLRSERVAAVVSSELSRSVQTAEIAAGVLGLPVRVRERLQEFAVGDYLGEPFDPVFFHQVLGSWLKGDLEPGVPGGESGRQVVDRVMPVLEEIADDFRGETVLVVTHGGVVLALFGLLAPDSPYAPAHEDDVPNGASYLFERDADGWRVTGAS